MIVYVYVLDWQWWYKLEASREFHIHADTEIKLKAYDNAG